MYYYGIDYDDSSLTHYGVKGMKWGVRNKLRRYGLVDKQIKTRGKDYANQKNYERSAKGHIGISSAMLAGTGYGIYKIAKAKNLKQQAVGLGIGLGSQMAYKAAAKHINNRFKENSRRINDGKIKYSGYTPLIGGTSKKRQEEVRKAAGLDRNGFKKKQAWE